MEKVSKSYAELIKASMLIQNYLSSGKDNILTESMKKFSKQLTQIGEDYEDRLDTIRLSNCIVDPNTKAILKDAKGERQFTVEGSIKIKEQIKLLLKEKIEITPVIIEGVEDLIKQLSEEEVEILSGIVIP
jgi:hypothetical protein